jgi:hypothetical protein|tara:strand:+ start:12080 stop:12199 length:120 start_codon:yes stop_codon:yes gene_type:complete
MPLALCKGGAFQEATMEIAEKDGTGSNGIVAEICLPQDV